MQPERPGDPLSSVLRRWRLQPARNRNFRDAVWHRIGREDRLTWGAYLRGHLVGWSVAALLAIVGAGWSGHAMARARLDEARNAMVVSYLAELDPRVLARLQP